MAWVTTADGIASPKHRPGLTVTYPGLQLKSLELLKEVFPAITRVALLIAPLELDAKEIVQEMEAGARRLGLQIQVLEVRGRDGGLNFTQPCKAARASKTTKQQSR